MQEQLLRQAIVSWIRGLYGPTFPVIYDWQAAPESGPYVAFRIGSTVSKGYDSKLGLDGAFMMNVGGLRQSTIGITYFGYSPENGIALNYCEQNACRISDSLELTSVQQAFSQLGFAYMHKNPVQNLTYRLESKYQPRADFEFFLGFVAKQTDDNSYIETVKVTGQITAGSVTEDFEEIVTV